MKLRERPTEFCCKIWYSGLILWTVRHNKPGSFQIYVDIVQHLNIVEQGSFPMTLAVAEALKPNKPIPNVNSTWTVLWDLDSRAGQFPQRQIYMDTVTPWYYSKVVSLRSNLHWHCQILTAAFNLIYMYNLSSHTFDFMHLNVDKTQGPVINALTLKSAWCTQTEII